MKGTAESLIQSKINILQGQGKNVTSVNRDVILWKEASRGHAPSEEFSKGKSWSHTSDQKSQRHCSLKKLHRIVGCKNCFWNLQEKHMPALSDKLRHSFSWCEYRIETFLNMLSSQNTYLLFILSQEGLGR